MKLFCIAWVIFITILLWSCHWELRLARSVSRYAFSRRKAMHRCFVVWFCLDFALVRLRFGVCLFVVASMQFGCKELIPLCSSVLLLSSPSQCLPSGTAECPLVTSKPFNEIVLKSVSAKSPPILVPLTPSAFLQWQQTVPRFLLLLVFLTRLMKLPGFYTVIKGCPFCFKLHAAKCHLGSASSFQHSVLSSYHV